MNIIRTGRSGLLLTVLAVFLMTSCTFIYASEDKWESEDIYTSSDYEYIVLENGTIEIIGYSGENIILTIPQVLDGKSVTSLAAGAFSDCNYLRRVIISDNVINIEANPFINCANLYEISVSPDHPVLSVIDGILFSKPDKRLIWSPKKQMGEYVIPDGIEIIGESAFYNCDNLTSIVIPDSVEIIGDSAFYSCDNLNNIVLPETITSIGNSVFGGCKSLAKLIIPDSIISLGDNAFYGCTGLTNILLPDGLEKIGDRTFSSCINLKSILLPASITEIGENPFINCRKMSSVIVSAYHPTLEIINGVLFTRSDKRLVWCPVTKEGEYTIPEGTEIIGGSAFFGCKNLTGIIFPGSISYIGDEAFNSCSELKSILLPDSITETGKNPFLNCISLSSIIVSSYHPALESIGGILFNKNDQRVIWCSVLREGKIEIPEGTEIIGEEAFYGCQYITNIVIPESVKEIGEEAFSGCENIAFTVLHDSFAEYFCLENNLRYLYSDSLDWLTD